MSNNQLITRRYALRLGIASLAGIGVVAQAKSTHSDQQIQALYDADRRFSVDGIASLKERATNKGLLYGAATRLFSLNDDRQYASQFAQECNILVPDSDLKWHIVCPQPNVYDFSVSDGLAEFARTHDLLYRGHTLVWHLSVPKWFEETVNPQNAEQIFVKYITTVVKHYAGQMHSWDVVNEAIEPKGRQPDGLRNTPWLSFMGPSYIERAFQLAAEFDPNALLVYNDFALEYDTFEHAVKRDAVLRLLERLKSKGIPVHALGIQSHLVGHETRWKPEVLRDFLRDVASLGLKILITELDVMDRDLPADVKVRDQIVASIYEDYLSVVLDEPAVIAVITWGLSDRYSWLSQQYNPRPDNAPARPLPLDDQSNRKLAWNAIARAFDNAPKR